MEDLTIIFICLVLPLVFLIPCYVLLAGKYGVKNAHFVFTVVTVEVFCAINLYPRVASYPEPLLLLETAWISLLLFLGGIYLTVNSVLKHQRWINLFMATSVIGLSLIFSGIEIYNLLLNLAAK